MLSVNIHLTTFAHFLYKILSIANIDPRVSESDLHSLFLPFGPITSVSLPYDNASLTRKQTPDSQDDQSNTNHSQTLTSQSLRNKGFADIQYETEDDASAAIDNMDGFEYLDKPLRVRRSIKLGNESSLSTSAVSGNENQDQADDNNTTGNGIDLETLDKKKAIWGQ